MTISPIRNVDQKALSLIAQGGAVLGAGGGGDAYVGQLMAQQVMGDDKTVEVVDIDSLPDDALILPIAMMGAPSVMLEKFPSGRECPDIIATMSKLLGKEVSAILCIEAGGLNSTIPFIAATQSGLPIVDADAMGRAFPELQMVTFTLGGLKATPMAMFDDKGNGVTFDTISNQWTEKLARAITVEMGGAAMIGLYPVTVAECRDYLIRGSVSLMHGIGEIMENQGAAAATTIAETLGGAQLFHGRVRDVERRSEDGWTKGTVKLEGMGDFRGRGVSLSFQNEYLLASEEDTILATTPDLITVMDANTGQPLTTDAIKFGLSVIVLVLPCDPIWRTEEGLKLVGPRYFGLDVDYKSIS